MCFEENTNWLCFSLKTHSTTVNLYIIHTFSAQAKELAVNDENPHLYTIATLTGHACLAVGDHSIGNIN